MKKVYFLFLTCLSILSVSGQSNVTQLDVIKTHLVQTEEFKLLASDLNDLEVTDSHTDVKNVSYIYLRQSINGLPVFNSTATVAIQNQLVVHTASRLIGSATRRMVSSTFSVDHVKAFESLINTLNVNDYQVDSNVFNVEGKVIKLKNTTLSNEALTFEKGFYNETGLIKPVWKIWYYTKDYKNMYEAYVDASSREIVRLLDLVLTCSFDQHDACNHLISGAMPAPKIQETNQTLAVNSYNVFAWPVESPNHGNRTIVTDPANTKASPFGWHDINGSSGAEFTITRGNNVWAKDDRDANDNGGISPDGGADLIFDAAFDKTTSADLMLPAATVNLFYWNNLMHDVWYHYGYDEAAGNFQQNNYGKGGQGNDYVIADAQDGSGTNNANFGPRPEGQTSRMQMYLWSAGSAGEKFIVTSPSIIAGEYNAIQAGFGNRRLNKVPVTGKLVLVNDGTTNPTLACATLVNATQVSGNIAVIDRGSCNFDDKILKAQNAGAIGVVMINNVGGSPIVMGGDAVNVNIASVMISKADGAKLLDEMAKGDVTISMYDSSSGGVFYFDSDFDNGIIAHEYTHGISSRLTGGASNVSCLTNTEQMGEGWSDFLSLVMTHTPSDKGPDKRGIGTYVRNESTDGGGIRPYPYSTSFGINPVTYDYIKQNQFTVPHGVGSVWCSMLWDLYWAFIDVYGYDSDIYEGTGGNNMVMHLVMDGLKLQPCGPGFVDGRDAILKADELKNGGKNKLLIWTVFAKRGLGYSANQGSTNSKTDGVEAFDLPPSFGGYVIDKVGPPRVNAGDTILYTIKVKNIGDNALSEINITDSLTSAGIFLKSDGRCNLIFSNNTFKLKFNNLASQDSLECGYFVVVDTSAGGKEIVAEDFEMGDGNFTNTTINGNGSWVRTSSKSNSGRFSYFVNNPSAASDRTLNTTFDLTETAKPFLMFSHFYNTESTWDGAVVEIEVNGAWKDLGGSFVQNGYNDFIENNPASNIAGRPAFTGNSNDFVRSIVDLKKYAGNVVNIRFRFVSDGLQGAEGWYIDDVELWNNFGSITNKLYVEADGLQTQSKVVNSVIVNEHVKDSVVVIVVDVNETLVVYPNPAGYVTNVKFESKVDRTINLELFDITGHKLWDEDMVSNSTKTIHLEAYADGMYILRVTDGEEVKNIKLIRSSR